MIKTSETPGVICQCGAYLNQATDVETGCTPKEGDFSICTICLQLYRFDETLTLQEISSDDFVKLPSDIKLGLARKMRDLVERAILLRRAHECS